MSSEPESGISVFATLYSIILAFDTAFEEFSDSRDLVSDGPLDMNKTTIVIMLSSRRSTFFGASKPYKQAVVRKIKWFESVDTW